MPDRMTAPPVPAAQYVRMSTEHQRYSIASQSAAIATYAKANGFDLIASYADAGRSGLTLSGRGELQRLLDDALSGQAIFRALLIFDVSRWGRFQDSDESAHYEWLIRRAGIAVHYCAEPFDNDGSLASSVVKNLKRLMAAEYSRELSRKVFAGQVRLAAMGFRMGGPAPFGLRRLLVDAEGRPKALLKSGEWKILTSDRIVLVPGTPGEVALVRRIYSLCIDFDLSDLKIAKLLNSEGIAPPAREGLATPHRGHWTNMHVRRILTSESYCGVAIFNRRSCKLHGSTVRNPPDDWIRREGAYEAIVEPAIFRAAQGARAGRRTGGPYSDEQLLQQLRRLLAEAGKLSAELIVSTPGMPSLESYRHHFGTLPNAYARIGYEQTANPKRVTLPARVEPDSS